MQTRYGSEVMRLLETLAQVLNATSQENSSYETNYKLHMILDSHHIKYFQLHWLHYPEIAA